MCSLDASPVPERDPQPPREHLAQRRGGLGDDRRVVALSRRVDDAERQRRRRQRRAEERPGEPGLALALAPGREVVRGHAAVEAGLPRRAGRRGSRRLGGICSCEQCMKTGALRPRPTRQCRFDLLDPRAVRRAVLHPERPQPWELQQHGQVAVDAPASTPTRGTPPASPCRAAAPASRCRRSWRPSAAPGPARAPRPATSASCTTPPPAPSATTAARAPSSAPCW